jgi:polyribonucleotide 5'-hydroxyl-kinase
VCAHDCARRRLEYRPHDITWEAVAAEAVTGKTFVSPYPDKEGRPVVIMRPR